MPRVPTYDNFTVLPSVQPQVQMRAPAMADVGGQQLQQFGQALSRAGGEAGRIAMDMAQEANQVRVNDAMNKAVQAKLRLTYDPNEGFIHLKGDAALTRPSGKGLGDEYGEKFDQQIDAIAAGLGNDAQRAAFKQQASQVALQFRGTLTQHVAREYGDYQVSVQDGTIATARDQMALAWGDPNAVQQSRSAIQAAVAEQGRLKGLSAQQVEANTVAALSPGHAAVVTGAIDAGKLDYAREYMKQHNAEFTPAARLQLTKVLDEGDFDARAQTRTEELLTKAEGDTTRALQLARETLSGKDEDAVVARIKALDAEREAVRNRAQSRAKESAWDIYNNTGSINKIPPSLRSAMDPTDWSALKRTAKADAEAALAKAEVKTDPSIYYALTLASATDPNFKNEDLRKYFDRLSPGDRKHFIDLQGKAQKPTEVDNVVTASQQITNMTKTMGFKDEEAGLFAVEANKALSAAQTAKGRALTTEERQKELDRLVVSGEVKRGRWWLNDPNMRAFQAQAKGQMEQFVPSWTDDQKRKAKSALQRKGINEPTSEQIEAVLNETYGFGKK